MDRLEKAAIVRKGRKQSQAEIDHRVALLRGKKRTPEQRRRMSEAKKGKFTLRMKEALQKVCEANRGRSVAASTKAKLAAANKGRKHTEESKRRMSLLKSEYWRLHGPPTEAVRQKISEALKKSLASPELRKQMSQAQIGRKASEETLEKMRSSQRKRRAETFVSMETKRRMSIAQTGKKHSAEAIRKMSESRKGTCPPRQQMEQLWAGNRGRKTSEETKIKLSKALKGKPMHPATKAALLKANCGRKHTEGTKRRIAEASRGRKHTLEARAKISKNRRGILHSEETRRRYSLMRKGKGTGRDNPSFGRSSPIGSGRSWSGWYKGWYFRSLSELTYVVETVEPSGWQWESADQSTLRVVYKDESGKEKTYAADLWINKTLLIEIKPAAFQTNPDVILKAVAAEAFCKANGFRYQMVDVPRSISKARLRILRDTGAVVLLEKWNKRLDAA